MTSVNLVIATEILGLIHSADLLIRIIAPKSDAWTLGRFYLIIIPFYNVFNING